MRIKKPLLLLAFATIPAIWAHAGTSDPRDDKKGEPSISGTVSDAESKKPVQGVIVSISGKGQDKKETITTDASGNFKTNQLMPGEVTIVLEKKGYKTYKKQGVVIKEGMTLKINMDIEEDDDDSGVFHPLLRMIDGD